MKESVINNKKNHTENKGQLKSENKIFVFYFNKNLFS